MKEIKIAMIGAGSGFVVSVARELVILKVLSNCTFTLMDINEKRLHKARDAVSNIFAGNQTDIKLEVTTSLEDALRDCDYVITSCEINRYPFWIKDLGIPERYGVYQVQGENGGPGGLIHAMRNISLFMDIIAAMEKHCPEAWLMNFTNPMSILCTYFKIPPEDPGFLSSGTRFFWGNCRDAGYGTRRTGSGLRWDKSSQLAFRYPP